MKCTLTTSINLTQDEERHAQGPLAESHSTVNRLHLRFTQTTKPPKSGSGKSDSLISVSPVNNILISECLHICTKMYSCTHTVLSHLHKMLIRLHTFAQTAVTFSLNALLLTQSIRHLYVTECSHRTFFSH